ncbi:hypothetical protein NX059_005941 [Plenodomus lindquistii]|nr:hypothetical protein NX059_005941 [Plenodomus lindquistii]
MITWQSPSTSNVAATVKHLPIFWFFYPDLAAMNPTLKWELIADSSLLAYRKLIFVVPIHDLDHSRPGSALTGK